MDEDPQATCCEFDETAVGEGIVYTGEIAVFSPGPRNPDDQASYQAGIVSERVDQVFYRIRPNCFGFPSDSKMLVARLRSPAISIERITAESTAPSFGQGGGRVSTASSATPPRGVRGPQTGPTVRELSGPALRLVPAGPAVPRPPAARQARPPRADSCSCRAICRAARRNSGRQRRGRGVDAAYTRAARRPTDHDVAATATRTAAIAVLVAVGYDNSSVLFSGFGPAVHRRLGPGPFPAVLAALTGLGAALLSLVGTRERYAQQPEERARIS